MQEAQGTVQGPKDILEFLNKFIPLIILNIKYLRKSWRGTQSTYYSSMIYVIDFKVKHSSSASFWDIHS